MIKIYLLYLFGKRTILNDGFLLVYTLIYVYSTWHQPTGIYIWKSASLIFQIQMTIAQGRLQTSGILRRLRRCACPSLLHAAACRPPPDGFSSILQSRVWVSLSRKKATDADGRGRGRLQLAGRNL